MGDYSNRELMTVLILRQVMEPRIVISSLVQPYEDAEKIVESINVFFPDWNSEDLPKKGTFPNKNKAVIISGCFCGGLCTSYAHMKSGSTTTISILQSILDLSAYNVYLSYPYPTSKIPSSPHHYTSC